MLKKAGAVLLAVIMAGTCLMTVFAEEIEVDSEALAAESAQEGAEPQTGYQDIITVDGDDPVVIAQAADSGKAGTLNWSVEDTTLTITGSGAMSNYSSSSLAPWHSYCDSITTVIIGSGVTSIGKLAFYEMAELTTVTIPASVTSMGEAAFYYCGSLTTVSFSGDSKLSSVGKACFCECSSLSELTLPSSVKTLSDYFLQGTGITSFTVPKNAAGISDCAFFGAAYLQGINVEEGNAGLSASDGVLFNKARTKLLAYPSAKTSQSYTVPSTVETIGSNAFMNASGLKTISLSNVKTIEEWAFSKSGLTQIVLPDSVTSLDNGILYECSDLTSVEFGTGIRTIPYRTCYECYSLKSITIKSAAEIENQAFIYSGLEEVTIPSCVKTIGVAAFGGCDSLQTVAINGSATIGYQAFADCRNLSSVTMGEGVKTICAYAFRNSKTDRVTIPASCTFVHELAFPTATTITNKNSAMMAYGNLGYVDTLTISGKNHYTYAYQVLNLVNNERKKAGLKALSMDEVLLDDAMLRAAETVILFSHGRPNGDSVVGTQSWISSTPGLNIVQGENIASGYATPAAAMKGWMNSSGHKANILGEDWSTIGVGCFEYGGQYYWVQTFSAKTVNTDFAKPADKNVTAPIHIEENSFTDPTNDEDVKFSFKMTGPETLGLSKTGKVSLKLNGATFNAKSVDWVSSNKLIATVDANGNVQGKQLGAVTISAYSRGYKRASVTIDIVENYPIYRLYNPKTSEHLWTASKKEYTTLPQYGWKQEGTAWYAPETGKGVYRLYNSKTGDHHYTSSENEASVLTTQYGWTYDNNKKPLFYSGGNVPVYRLYNKKLKRGAHHLTKSVKEYDTLPQYGWKQEGVALKCVK